MRVFCMKEEQICKGLDYVIDLLVSPASLGLGIQLHQCYSSHLGLVPPRNLRNSCQEGSGLSVLMMRVNKENLDKQYPTSSTARSSGELSFPSSCQGSESGRVAFEGLIGNWNSSFTLQISHLQMIVCVQQVTCQIFWHYSLTPVLAIELRVFWSLAFPSSLLAFWCHSPSASRQPETVHLQEQFVPSWLLAESDSAGPESTVIQSNYTLLAR